MENIKNLHEKVRKLQKEIQQYQETCKHKTTQIRAIENGEPRKVCTECELVLGWPTKEELESWLNS
mgnify:CR=1 FL=1